MLCNIIILAVTLAVTLLHLENAKTSNVSSSTIPAPFLLPTKAVSQWIMIIAEAKLIVLVFSTGGCCSVIKSQFVLGSFRP